MSTYGDWEIKDACHSLIVMCLVYFYYLVCGLDEIQFDCSMRIIRGDNFRLNLLDPSSQQFRTKSDRYRRLVSFVCNQVVYT